MCGADTLVSIRQFARELSVCVKTIYRRIDAGEIPRPVKIGRCSRYPRSVIEDYKRRLGLRSTV